MGLPLNVQAVMPPPFKMVELTDEQRKKWEQIHSYFYWTVPGLQHIMLRLLVNNNGKEDAIFTTDIPTAMTDAKNIIINPEWFFSMKPMEGLFVLVHEVAHVMRGDCEMMFACGEKGMVPMNDGTSLPFDQDMANKAMDFVINAMLVDSRIGRMPEKGCLDTSKFKGDDSWLDVYQTIYKRKKRGEGDLPGEGFDELLPPGKSMGLTPQQAKRDEGVWQVELQAAQEIERSRGKMAGGLMKLFKDLLEPEVDWTDKLATLVSRKWGPGSYDWKRPDKRFASRDMYLPARAGNAVGWLVIWNDTSGSMNDHELEKCNAELVPIVEDCNPRRCTVIWCDAAIHNVDEIEDPSDLTRIRARGITGRGGTSISPVMQWIADQMEDPDMFIGFTDGEFPFPNEPKFPAIWCSVRDTTYPYGDVVRINKEKATRRI